MAAVEIRSSLWEALAGRAPAQPAGPADPGLWAAVVDRLNPAKARPRLRDGVEQATLTTARGADYVMLRSPEAREADYLRLTPQEAELATRMDGEPTVARLVAEFAKISGRLAPDQVTRVVADLAGNRMLDELPLDAFRPLDKVHQRPRSARIGRGLLAAARGQRAVLGNIDRLAGFAYRFGGKLLFTKPAAVLLALVAAAGLAVFVLTWAQGAQSVFLTGDSYLLGALTLLGLNVIALSCHEMGHALAAKHAGRKVGSAGFMMYFGIPTVFVDTTDVWMAGRRARLLTTFAGPAAALTMAGGFQLVALAVPAFAPLAFKLSFAWYLNSLFNLNPLMALDGYYLAMDYLEIPNLRARGIAFLAGSVRRRGPRWSQLDREGRLIALYGILSVLWLVVMANLLYRLYKDRVSGLVVGLWHSGPAAQVLLVAIAAGLLSPLLYVLIAWLARLPARVRTRMAERRRASDQPRRLDALRTTAFSKLPPERLTELAALAQWVRPRRGSEVATAGAAMPNVYAVIDGALEARHPGDPTGTVRSRVAAGGLVGVAPALTGAPSALTWRAAGTRLLGIPTGAVARAVGPISGPPPAERAELESLLADTPALRDLTEEDRLGLYARGKAVDVAPAQQVSLKNATTAAVVAAGVLELPDGTTLRRGGLLGPGEGTTATARTRARIWTLPAVAGLPLLLGAEGSLGGSGSYAEAATTGVHAAGGYPPLAARPGPPTGSDDGRADGRFERRLRRLLLLLLLLALLLTWVNTRPPVLWAEQPDDRALLIVDRGTVQVAVGKQSARLNRGDRSYLGEGAMVAVDPDSVARLAFRGGGFATLCAGSRLQLGQVRTLDRAPSLPTGRLSLEAGTIVTDTTRGNRAFRPLDLSVVSADRLTNNDGAARFEVRAGGFVRVAGGTVTLDDRTIPPSADRLGCGGSTGQGSGAGTPGLNPTTSGSEPPATSVTTPPGTTTTEPTSTTGPTSTTTTGPTSTGPTTTTTKPKSQPPPPPVTTTTTTVPPPPPDTTPPSIGVPGLTNRVIDMQGGSLAPCGPYPTTTRISATVTDNVSGPGLLTVWFTYTVRITPGQSGTESMSPSGSQFAGTLGPIPYNSAFADGGSITTVLHARDAAGNEATRTGPNVILDRCN